MIYVQSTSVLFQKNNISYNLRKSDFIMPRYNTVKYGRNSLRYAGPFLWSKLTNDIRKNNLEIFVGDDNCKNFPLCMG